MPYEPTVWQDRAVEKPRTFAVTNNPDGTVTLTPAPGTIVQEGTSVNADKMNNLERQYNAAKADLDAKMHQSNGHKHTGVAGDGPILPAARILYDGILQDPWIHEPDIPFNALYASAVLVNTTLYIIGGYTTNPQAWCWAYDTVLKTWTQKADMLYACYGGATALLGDGKIYKAGATGTTQKCQQYDPTSNLWTEKLQMPVVRYSTGGSGIGNFLYVVGGTSSGSDYQNSNYAYDCVGNTWTTKAVYPLNTSSTSVIGLGGYVYSFGGGGSSGAQNGVYRYDPAANSWLARTSLGTARYNMALASDGVDVYLVGGYSTIKTVERYSPSGNTYSTLKDAPEAGGASWAAWVNGQLCIGPAAQSLAEAHNLYRYDASRQVLAQNVGPAAIIAGILPSGMVLTVDRAGGITKEISAVDTPVACANATVSIKTWPASLTRLVLIA